MIGPWRNQRRPMKSWYLPPLMLTEGRYQERKLSAIVFHDPNIVAVIYVRPNPDALILEDSRLILPQSLDCFPIFFEIPPTLRGHNFFSGHHIFIKFYFWKVLNPKRPFPGFYKQRTRFHHSCTGAKMKDLRKNCIRSLKSASGWGSHPLSWFFEQKSKNKITNAATKLICFCSFVIL